MAGDDDLSPVEDWGPLEEDWAPVHFLVPPPPPPPSLGSVCSAGNFYCQIEGGPMGAHFNRASFPSLPIIAVCSSVVLVAVLVASFLLWRHKTKVQNLLPCKHDQQGHLGELAAANGVTYEDVLINHHTARIPQGHIGGSQTLMPLELLDVKLGDIGPPPVSLLNRNSFYPGRDPGQVLGKPFNPVYEEVSQAPSGDKSTTGKSYESDLEESGKIGGRSLTSEDDFAEDEFSAVEYPSGEGSGQCSATSSVRGSTGGDLCKDPVSSDEGTGEDCDYTVNDLPEMLPGDCAFNFPRKHLGFRADIGRDKLRAPMQVPRGHQHNMTTYPHPERTLPPSQRIIEPTLSEKPHSKTDNKKRILSPTHVPLPSFAPLISSNLKNNPANAPWLTKPAHDERLNFPSSGPSQENIYSTIDEDEPTDYHIHPSLTSLACPQRGNATPTKRSSAVPKNVSARSDRHLPSLSQRNAEDNGSSYGDIMPAFSTPYT